jgi:hypothetical protein
VPYGTGSRTSGALLDLKHSPVVRQAMMMMGRIYISDTVVEVVVTPASTSETLLTADWV